MASDSEKKPWTSYFWNSDRGEFLGRDGVGWLLLLLFYFCYYAVLALFWISLLAVFYETISTDEPRWYGEKSLTQDNPGIGMRPLPHYDTTLLRFVQGKPSSYKPYADHIEAFLLSYNEQLQKGRDIIDCVVTNGETDKKPDKACRIDLDKVLGPCTVEKDFGYEDGEPCILLKMNRVFGFTPIAYENLDQLMKDNEMQEAPRFLAFSDNTTVGVSCEGENLADRENLEELKFYPNPTDTPNAAYSGIPVVSFPYLNQEGYRSPFIMVKFTKFTKRVVIQIVCTLYAKNIDNSGTARRYGTIRFELLKD